jgi:E3 ubiquitin-protein ligase DOA10
MDINAAIQALIESNAALQMEVIYQVLFTLAISIYKLNTGTFWRPKCDIISKTVFKTLKLFSRTNYN